MKRFAICLAFAMFCATAVPADDAADLKKKIADAEKALAALKAELAKIEGSEVVKFGKPGELRLGYMKPGDCGEFNANDGEFRSRSIHEVAEIISGDSFRMYIDSERHSTGSVIVKGYKTEGMAEKTTINWRQIWNVVGTEKHNGSTYYVVRLAPEPKKQEIAEPKNKKPQVEAKKAEPAPATLTPPAKGFAEIATEKGFLNLGKGFEDARAKRVKSDEIVELTEAKECELIENAKGVAKIKIDGKVYYTEAKWVTEKK